MAGLIRRDLTSAFKLLRDRSSHNAADFYDLDRDENVRSFTDIDDLIPSWTKTLDDESALSFRSSDSPSGHSGRIRLYFQPCSEATVNFMNI